MTSVAESGFRLSVVPEPDSPESALAGLPVRLDVKGWLTEPVDGIEMADFKVFLDTAAFTDLLAQCRALQHTLVQRARRQAEADAQAADVAGGTAALREMVAADAKPPSDPALFLRLVKGLRALPDVAPPKPATDSMTNQCGPWSVEGCER